MANTTRLRRRALVTGTGLLMSAGAVVGMLGTSAVHADAGSGGSVTVETYSGSPSDQIELADSAGATAPGSAFEIDLGP